MVTEWRAHKVGLIAFDELVANKRASGRTKDLADVQELEKLQRAKAARPRG